MPPDPIVMFADALDLKKVQPKTRRTYLAVARSFVKSAGRPPRRGYPRAAYTTFFGRLAKAGLSPSYLHLNYAALRRFMKVLELPAPSIELNELPKLSRTTPETWIEPGDVERMIRVVLAGRAQVFVRTTAKGTPDRRFGSSWLTFNDEERCAVALAATYGLRASEICTTEVDGDHVIIHVAKSGGRTVRQLIPDEIRPYIMCAPIGHSEDWCRVLYHKLERAIGYKGERDGRSGFHHFRRAVNTALVRAGLPDALVQRFMRWKPPGFSGPLYYLRAADDELDYQVFQSHPFIPMWADARTAPAPSKTPDAPRRSTLAGRNGHETQKAPRPATGRSPRSRRTAAV